MICILKQGLAKKLRSCGVDAEALENDESWDRCYRYYERERRTVLTRGNNYHKLTKYIPVQCVYNVKSEVILFFVLSSQQNLSLTHQGRNLSLLLHPYCSYKSLNYIYYIFSGVKV